MDSATSFSSPFGLFQNLIPYSLSDLFNYWPCNVWYCPLLQISPLASEFLDISLCSKTTSVQTFIGHFFFLPVWVAHKFLLGWNILLLRMFTWSATAFCSIYFVWKEQDQWGRNNFTTIFGFTGMSLTFLGKEKKDKIFCFHSSVSFKLLNYNLLVRLHPSLKALNDFWSKISACASKFLQFTA